MGETSLLGTTQATGSSPPRGSATKLGGAQRPIKRQDLLLQQGHKGDFLGQAKGGFSTRTSRSSSARGVAA